MPFAIFFLGLRLIILKLTLKFNCNTEEMPVGAPIPDGRSCAIILAGAVIFSPLIIVGMLPIIRRIFS